ncbi:MAG TPA: TraB/GumN family protein [Lysobacter sp.]|nr:TraB/GumN family protein [Lysobacter sp.]
MRRLHTLFAAVALALGIAAAPARAADPAPVPLLWKVSDADNSVYLLGSFHLLRPTDYPLSGEVYAALADAEQVLFEVAPEAMASPEAAQAMLMAALRRDGTALDSELPPALAARLREWLAENRDALAKASIPEGMLQAMEPWFVGLLVAQMQLSELGMQPELGLDRHLADRAREAGKPSGGLETVDDAIAALDGLSPALQRQMLEEALESAQANEAEQLHAGWRRGEVAVLEKALAEMRAEYPELYRRVNLDRNTAWLGQLEARLREAGDDDTLAVVGALHLAGSDGLVERLRAKGYRVERICAACKR